jgi:hypothetical protein
VRWLGHSRRRSTGGGAKATGELIRPSMHIATTFVQGYNAPHPPSTPEMPDPDSEVPKPAFITLINSLDSLINEYFIRDHRIDVLAQRRVGRS